MLKHDGILVSNLNPRIHLERNSKLQVLGDQWICQHLPSCCPGFKSQAHHLRFRQFIDLCNAERTKINKKRGREWPFKKNYLQVLILPKLDRYFSKAKETSRDIRYVFEVNK